MSLKGKKKLFLIIIIVFCCMAACGYVLVFSDLNINSFIKINGKKQVEVEGWKVKFDSAELLKTNGYGKSYQIPSFTETKIEFYPEFTELKDSVTYKFVVKNTGTIDAKLSKIGYTELNNDSIDYKLDGIEEGTVIKSGRSLEGTITFTYARLSEYSKHSLYSVISLMFIWVQNEK